MQGHLKEREQHAILLWRIAEMGSVHEMSILSAARALCEDKVNISKEHFTSFGEIQLGRCLSATRYPRTIPSAKLP